MAAVFFPLLMAFSGAGGTFVLCREADGDLHQLPGG
jgi:hypothetical protein